MISTDLAEALERFKSDCMQFKLSDEAAMLRNLSMFSLCDQRKEVCSAFHDVMDEANFSSCLRNLFSTGDLDAVCLAGLDVVGPVVDLEVEPTGGGYRGDEFVCLDKSLCACSTKFPAVCCKYIYLPNQNSARFGDYGSFGTDSGNEFDFCLVYDRGKEAERS